MPNPIITVENLSKLYRIGVKEKGYKTIRESIIDGVTAPIRNLKRLRKLTKFNDVKNNPLPSALCPVPSPSEDTIWAIKDISFKVQPGEVVGIIGRNGAGKSTILKILSRITEPTTGDVKIYGRVASLLEVGTGFHPELTGRENVFLNGAILGMRKWEIKKKFDEIVNFAEIEKFLDTPVKRYSSGMRVRLAFAVAAHLEPEVLLVDEVLAVGDAVFQQKCIGKMQSVAGEGRTVIFISHNMHAIERLCNRAILLVDGKIAQSGSVNQVVDSYLVSGFQRLGERVWRDSQKAPGNDVVRLRAVRALNTQNIVSSEFKVYEAFSIEIEFWVLRPGHKLDAGLIFYDARGEMILLTADFQDPRWQNQTRPVGIHHSRCYIPENLLNQGSIRVHCGISTNPHTSHAVERDAIHLQIIDDMKFGGARGNYTREWPGGAFRPLLKWDFGFESIE